MLWTGEEMWIYTGDSDIWSFRLPENKETTCTWCWPSIVWTKKTWFAAFGVRKTYRYGFVAVWASAHREMYVHGGVNHSTVVFGDLWKYSDNSKLWEQINFDGGPQARTYHVGVWREEKEELFIQGGTGDGEIFSDLWKYSVPDNTWTLLSQSAPARFICGGLAAENSGDLAAWWLLPSRWKFANHSGLHLCVEVCTDGQLWCIFLCGRDCSEGPCWRHRQLWAVWMLQQYHRDNNFHLYHSHHHLCYHHYVHGEPHHSDWHHDDWHQHRDKYCYRAVGRGKCRKCAWWQRVAIGADRCCRGHHHLAHLREPRRTRFLDHGQSSAVMVSPPASTFARFFTPKGSFS